MADTFIRTGRFLFLYKDRWLTSALMPPGTIWVLIAFKSAWPLHWPVAVASLQLSLSLAMLWIILQLAELVFNSPRAVLSVAWLYILDLNLYIPLAWANETVYTMFFVLLSVYLVLRFVLSSNPSLGAAGLIGVVYAVGSLFRSPLLAHFVVALAWISLLLWRRISVQRIAALLVVSILGFSLTISPWVYRNWVQFHRIIPVSQNIGLNLWSGWNPDAGGSTYGEGGRVVLMSPALEHEMDKAATEPEIDNLLIKASFGYARENPKRWIRQRLLCFAFFWHEHNFWAPYSPFRTPSWRVVGWCNLFFVFVFFGCVIFTASGRGPIQFVSLILALHSIIYALIHADIGSRFRYQIEPLMLIVIVYGFFQMGSIRSRDSTR